MELLEEQRILKKRSGGGASALGAQPWLGWSAMVGSSREGEAGGEEEAWISD